jgi:hypothetical protein
VPVAPSASSHPRFFRSSSSRLVIRSSSILSAGHLYP